MIARRRAESFAALVQGFPNILNDQSDNRENDECGTNSYFVQYYVVNTRNANTTIAFIYQNVSK